MRENRLDRVLIRNRKQLILDVALAAFFVVALLLTGLAFGTELPKLSMAQVAPAKTAVAPLEVGSDGVGLASPASDTALHLAHR